MKRLTPHVRKSLLLEASISTATVYGLRGATRERIAQSAGVSPGLVSLYLGTMARLRRTVMREAIKREILPLVAEGLALRNTQAIKAPDALKRRAIDSLA